MLDHKSGEESLETFDAVLVCTGHHAEKHEPTFSGLADFKGEVLHSHDYREPSRFAGKRILIIGIGNSGGDMAVELSRQGQVSAKCVCVCVCVCVPACLPACLPGECSSYLNFVKQAKLNFYV